MTGDRGGHVRDVKHQLGGIIASSVVGKLAEARGVASDGALVSGPQLGVRVVGVVKGDPVASLEPAAHVTDLADPGEGLPAGGFGCRG